jgi:N-acetylmuramoyl-L-alanine amidase
MILVSAGHGGRDPGAIYGDFVEHDEAVKWRDAIVTEIAVLRTPVLTVPIGTLEQKVGMINNECLKAKCIAIECHFNSGGTPNATSGCETLYCPGSQAGEMLATLVQDELVPYFKPNRGIKLGYFRGDPHRTVDYFLRASHCPAIIMEPEFVQWPDLIQKNRIAACRAIAKALVRAHFILQDTQ